MVFFDKDTAKTDTIENVPIRFNNSDTLFYYPVISATCMYYVKDTLFVSFGKGIITYVRNNMHFEYDNIVYFTDWNSEQNISNIIEYNGKTLALGCQNFNKNKSYYMFVFDIKKQEITKQLEIETDNSILLPYYDIYNVFGSNGNTLSFMNTIKPELYLYDYELNPTDTIFFALNDSYRTTSYILDTNVAANKGVITPQNAKTILMLLDNINILNYYSNIKQMFVDDTTLLVFTLRMNADSCDVIKINTKNNKKEVLLSYPKFGTTSPYVALTMGSNISLFNDGTFFTRTKRLDSLQENIIFGIDWYYSSILDFEDRVIGLEDRKGQEIKVNTKEYDGIIVFDDYFCKTCFANSKQMKLLLIYHTNKIDGIRKLSLYNELKKIYPKSDILFNCNNKFDVKRNIILRQIKVG